MFHINHTYQDVDRLFKIGTCVLYIIHELINSRAIPLIGWKQNIIIVNEWCLTSNNMGNDYTPVCRRTNMHSHLNELLHNPEQIKNGLVIKMPKPLLHNVRYQLQICAKITFN